MVKTINIMINQTIYRLIKVTTLALMTRFFDLNYFKDVRANNQTHNSYPIE